MTAAQFTAVYARAARSRDHRTEIECGAGRSRDRIGADTGDGRGQERDAADHGDRRLWLRRRAADRQDVRRGPQRRALAADPPDVGGASAGLRQASLAQGPSFADPDPARRWPRAAPARVRHEAARLGQADGDIRGRSRRDGRDARPRGLAGAALGGAGARRSPCRVTCIRCFATSA